MPYLRACLHQSIPLQRCLTLQSAPSPSTTNKTLSILENSIATNFLLRYPFRNSPGIIVIILKFFSCLGGIHNKQSLEMLIVMVSCSSNGSCKRSSWDSGQSKRVISEFRDRSTTLIIQIM